MNEENSIYETLSKLLKLEQIYHKQERFLANKEKLEQFAMVKECFEIMNEITQPKFRVDPPSEDPKLKLDRASACNLQQHTTNLFDFYNRGADVIDVPHSNDLEKGVNLLTASCRKNEEHLELCQSIAESFDLILEKVKKSNNI
ncbi:hypothetical protein PPYR_05079 [Photinus pyralis]|uniref:Uncharacterized protein n=1 Tax=Photinus pyralis TaxID=7054 RepID=A0A1Y1K7K2_PHOPY|nr:hypothetical protein PPYR_05079 [Photinus pyralis]